MIKSILVILLVTTVAQAETYKWTDKEGTVHFSEALGGVPAQYLKSAQPLGVDLNESTRKNGVVSSSEHLHSPGAAGSVAPDVEELKERMLKDEGTMERIRALQNDPEMQVLLSNPAMLRAIQAGDIGTLTNNPDFMKLLNNPRVREIEKAMHNNGTK